MAKSEPDSSAIFACRTDLGRQLVMPHAGAGENRQLLAPDQGHHAVDGGDAGLDEVPGIHPGHGVDGGAVDVPLLHRKNIAQAVDGATGAVEDTAQKLGRQGHFHRVAQQTGAGVVQGDAIGAFEHLDNHPFPLHLDDTPGPFGAIVQADGNRFLEGGVLDAV